MDKLSFKGKESSRRRFTTSILGAVAALPFLEVLASAQEQKKQTSKAVPPIITHDTPPPIVLIDGSMTIEAEEEMTLPNTPTQGRWVHQGGVNRPIFQLRVIHGNGLMEHNDCPAVGSVITIDLEDDRKRSAGNLIITGTTPAVPNSRFKIDGDQRLFREAQGRRRRKHRYGHPGQGPDFRVKRITITKPGTATKIIEPPAGHDECQEYRILIWNVEEHCHKK